MIIRRYAQVANRLYPEIRGVISTDPTRRGFAGYSHRAWSVIDAHGAVIWSDSTCCSHKDAIEELSAVVAMIRLSLWLGVDLKRAHKSRKMF